VLFIDEEEEQWRSMYKREWCKSLGEIKELVPKAIL
jgi:hypothetical protein